MRIHQLAIAFLIALVPMLPTDIAANAQVARYQPPTPTISPYLNLTRINLGGVPNYYAWVRPELQQRQFNIQSEANSRLQAAEIRTLQTEVQRKSIPAGATGTGSWFMVSGQHQFLNSSQYYPEPHFRWGHR